MESPQSPPVHELPALDLQAIGVHFRRGVFGRRTEVLKNLDLRLAPGESLGLVGPNGSGKSTLLRVACGIESPSSGSALMFGTDPRIASARGQVGFVPEGSPFPENLSAKTCLSLCADLQGLRGDESKRRCGEMLARVGLADAKTTLAKFSKGMLRRFALAQAFVHKPNLLLLDEPSSGLDAEGHAVLAALLAEARERGAAVIICSHHMQEAVGWTDGLALLLNGQLHREARAWITSEGSAQLEVDGLDAAALDELERTIGELGGRLLSRHPTTSALLKLYRENGEPL